MISEFNHLKIDVTDLDRSIAFYCGKLGFAQIVRYDRPDGVTIVQVSPAGQPPGLELWHEPAAAPLHCHAFEAMGRTSPTRWRLSMAG